MPCKTIFNSRYFEGKFRSHGPTSAKVKNSRRIGVGYSQSNLGLPKIIRSNEPRLWQNNLR